MILYRDIAWKTIQSLEPSLFKNIDQSELGSIILAKIQRQNDLSPIEVQKVNDYLSESLMVILALRS